MIMVTRAIGGLLVLVGVVAYLATDRQSPTALAPAAVGVLLLIFGFLAGKPERTRSMIHAALGVSLLGLLASGMPLSDLPALFAGDAERPGAVLAAAAMALLCLVHLGLGVRSFLAARRRRTAPTQ